MSKHKIGLLLVGNESWMGGVYYVMNIIKELDALPENRKPDMFVFYYRDTPEIQIQELSQIRSITLLPIYNDSYFSRMLNGIGIRLFGRNAWLTKYFDKLNLDIIYPWLSYDETVNCRAKKVCWIPDFQHHFLPEYFTDREKKKRDAQFSEIAQKANEIIFSSKNALDHFQEIYPSSKAIKHVFNFSSEAANVNLMTREDVLSKFGIDGPYFMVCNQFWKHKNHKLVLEVLEKLIEFSDKFMVVFTGKQEDYRHPEYVKELFQFIEKSKIKNALFLGFIDRVEQLSLMKYSEAIIQPSLFEGWGTVIEDAKVLGVPVLASDIPIHQEQLGNQGYYFKKDDKRGLTWLLRKVVSGELSLKHLELDQTNPAQEILQIFARIISAHNKEKTL
jgi:glycosyltransferase involved in cell wall biosynthesis